MHGIAKKIISGFWRSGTRGGEGGVEANDESMCPSSRLPSNTPPWYTKMAGSPFWMKSPDYGTALNEEEGSSWEEGMKLYAIDIPPIWDDQREWSYINVSTLRPQQLTITYPHHQSHHQSSSTHITLVWAMGRCGYSHKWMMGHSKAQPTGEQHHKEHVLQCTCMCCYMHVPY